MAKNTNCLEGLRCPKCGHKDEIIVFAKMWVSLNDDGTDPYADSVECGDVEYDENSPARCPECGHHGKMMEWERKGMGKYFILNVSGSEDEDNLPDFVFIKLDGTFQADVRKAVELLKTAENCGLEAVSISLSERRSVYADSLQLSERLRAAVSGELVRLNQKESTSINGRTFALEERTMTVSKEGVRFACYINCVEMNSDLISFNAYKELKHLK